MSSDWFKFILTTATGIDAHHYLRRWQIRLTRLWLQAGTDVSNVKRLSWKHYILNITLSSSRKFWVRGLTTLDSLKPLRRKDLGRSWPMRGIDAQHGVEDAAALSLDDIELAMKMIRRKVIT